jgi:hypothetical protein
MKKEGGAVEKLVEEFKELMERLEDADPKLSRDFVRVIRKMQRQFVKDYGRPVFSGWIDPWLKLSRRVRR